MDPRRTPAHTPPDELTKKFAPGEHSGRALSNFLGIVYGSVVPEDGIPSSIVWNGRRAALASLVTFLRSLDRSSAWNDFLTGRGGQSLRRKGSDPRRQTQDTLEELLCSIGLMRLDDTRLRGREGELHGGREDPPATEHPEAGSAGPPFRLVPAAGAPAHGAAAPPPMSPTSDYRGQDEVEEANAHTEDAGEQGGEDAEEAGDRSEAHAEAGGEGGEEEPPVLGRQRPWRQWPCSGRRRT